MNSLAKVLDRDNRVIDICKPKDGQLRSRKVISRSNSRSTLKYPSWKVGRMVHCESLNELNTFYLLDADPSVNDFLEQPVKIIYLENGQKKIHYPDVLIRRNDGLELLEIKEDLSHEPRSLFKRTQILKESLPLFGYSYRLVCGKKIKEENIRLSNAKYLLLHGRIETGLIEFERSRRFFIENKKICWKLYLSKKGIENNLGTLCNLILKGVISYDECLLINANTGLSWNGEEGEAM